MKALLAIVGIVVLPVMIYLLMWYSYVNSEVSLRNGVEAQVQVRATRFDTCWKIIQQVAQVTDKERKSFETFYPALMEAKGMDKGGGFMKWLQEAAPPSFDINKSFNLLSTKIEGQRMMFEREQKELIARNQEHKTLIQSVLGRHFLSGKQPIAIIIITSTATQNIERTGTEDDISVFQGEKP